MLSMIKQLFALLSKEQSKQFYILQMLVIIMAFTELLGIASIAPFMALVGDINIIETNRFLIQLYRISGLTNPTDFLFYSGIAVLLMLALSTVISMFTIWRLSIFGARVGTEIADRLYAFYMQQDWQFHANGSSAQLTKQVTTEATRISIGIVQPLMQMNAKMMLAVVISISVIAYDPMVAIIGLAIFSIAYLILYRLVRQKLFANGHILSLIATDRFRMMNEGFGGIKDVLLLNRSHDFVERFQQSGKVFAQAEGTNIALSQVPRYFIELIAFGAMISLVLLLINLHTGNLGEVLPILAFYALAAFKLLPALQQIYSNISQIKGNTAALEAVKEDLQQSFNDEKAFKAQTDASSLELHHAITLRDLHFSYPNKVISAVDGISLDIPVNSVIGIVGSSGSGKTTLIDILLGLLTPQSGSIYIDKKLITPDNKRAWQNLLGFVPQSIFLSEGSIAENIAFGLPAHDIDMVQIQNVVSLAHLTELVAELPHGVHTTVGERGVQLSGGQRQRIGIARALYHKAEVLVFDEATSALDGITEKIVMDAIHEFSGKKTIIMVAHRLKTVEKCNLIYFMEKGKIIDQGTYQQLTENNAKFREMVKYA